MILTFELVGCFMNKVPNLLPLRLIENTKGELSIPITRVDRAPDTVEETTKNPK